MAALAGVMLEAVIVDPYLLHSHTLPLAGFVRAAGTLKIAGIDAVA